MRLNLSSSSKPIKRRRSVSYVGTSCNTLSIDPKFSDVADFDCWSQHGRKLQFGFLKRSLAKMGRISTGHSGVGLTTTSIVPGRQDLTIRKRRRAIRQLRQQQQARRFLTLRKLSQCSLEMDPDQISQWSVPVAVAGASSEDEAFFTSHSHFLPLARSHSQQNFCDCDETEIYCYETTKIELPNAEKDNLDYHGNVSNVEPHLNYFVEKSGSFQIRDDFTNDTGRENYAQQDAYNDDEVDSITQSCVKDEDNLFDNLCHSGCLCSDNLENSTDQQDLLRCAEIQKTEITAKAFLVYVDYYATKCNTKILNGDDVSVQASDKWQSLSQKEKLPFLLQAYISDYLPRN